MLKNDCPKKCPELNPAYKTFDGKLQAFCKKYDSWTVVEKVHSWLLCYLFPQRLDSCKVCEGSYISEEVEGEKLNEK
jgi:hypothetical protein